MLKSFFQSVHIMFVKSESMPDASRMPSALGIKFLQHYISPVDTNNPPHYPGSDQDYHGT